MQHLSSSRWYTALSVLLLLLVSGVYSYLQRDQLISYLLNQSANPYHLYDIHLEQLNPGAGTLDIAHASLVYRTQTVAANIELHKIHITLSWAKMITRLIGRDTAPLQSLTVTNLEVDAVTRTQPNTAAPTHPFDSDQWLPGNLLALLPLQQLNVEHWAVTLNGQQFQGDTFATPNNNQLHTTATLPLSANDLLSLTLHSDSTTPLQLTAQWHNQDTNELVAQATLSRQNQPSANWVLTATSKLEALTRLQELPLLAHYTPALQHSLNDHLQRLDSNHIRLSGQVSMAFTTQDLTKLLANLPTHAGTPSALQPYITEAQPLSLSYHVQLQHKNHKIQAQLLGTTTIFANDGKWAIHNTPVEENNTPPNASKTPWLTAQLDIPWFANSDLQRYAPIDINALPSALQNNTIAISTNALAIAANTETLSAVLGDTRIDLTPGDTAWVATTGSSHHTTFSYKHPQARLEGDINLLLTQQDQTRHQQHWQGSYNWQMAEQQQTLAFNSKSAGAASSLTLNGTITPQHTQLAYTASSDNIATAMEALRQVLPPSRWPELLRRLQLTKGKATLNGTLTLPANSPTHAITARTEWALQAVSGLYDNTALQNVYGSGTLQGIPGITAVSSPTQQQFGAASVHGGIDLTQLEWQGTLASPSAAIDQLQVTSQHFSANLLGGTLTLTEPLTYHLAQQTAQGTLHAEHWQLAQLLALQKQNIQANGILDGDMHFTLTPNGLTIPAGALTARAPGGVIRYPTQEAQHIIASSPELGMAMRMLENFTYKALGATIKLDNAGELHVGLNLSGNNPAEMNGRAVEFNINIDQNVFPLLESLRLSDQVVKRLEQQVKQRSSKP